MCHCYFSLPPHTAPRLQCKHNFQREWNCAGAQLGRKGAGAGRKEQHGRSFHLRRLAGKNGADRGSNCAELCQDQRTESHFHTAPASSHPHLLLSPVQPRCSSALAGSFTHAAVREWGAGKSRSSMGSVSSYVAPAGCRESRHPLPR